MMGEVIVLAIAAVVIVALLRPKAPPAPPPIHDCALMGHNYQPAYDETGHEGTKMTLPLPQAGPFMDDKRVVEIAEANAKAIASAPRKRTYIHSVCTYCGLSVDRPKGDR